MFQLDVMCMSVYFKYFNVIPILLIIFFSNNDIYIEFGGLKLNK